MKVNTDNLLEQLGQILPLTDKAGSSSALSGSSPFAGMLENLVRQKAEGKQGFELLDKEQIMALVEMMSLRMSYAAMSSLGGLSSEDEESQGASSIFSSISHLPALESTDKAEQHIESFTHRNRASGLDESGYASIINRASGTYGVDSSLIRSVIRAESGFDPDATSPKGAMGLMQLMPDTARGLGVSNAYDPEQNIMAGTRYLKYLLDRYNGNVPLALAAYNWGMGNVERATGRYPEETRDYVSRIMKSYRPDSV